MKSFKLDNYRDTSAAGFTKRMLSQSAHALVFMLNFEAGQTLPTHTHGESEIVVTLVAGEGEATIDGKAEALGPGTVLRCEGSEAFGVRNTGQQPLSLMVVLAPGNPKFAGNVR